uniref:Uncharacterized protein n=1 Tax=Pinctada fucata TaxID=50426 RepID=A0A194AQA6_PINFU
MAMIKLFLVATCIALSIGAPVEQRNLSSDAEDVSVIAQHTGGLSGYLGGEYHAPDNSYNIGLAPHVNLNPGSHHVIDGGRVQGGVDLGHGVQLQGHVGGYQGHVDAGVGVQWNFGKRAES